MEVRMASLNSGSNGNCYYVGNEWEAVLIDAGLSCRETERRMSRLGLPMDSVKAVFISHEHSDHIRGVEVLAKKYQLPVFITPGTLSNSRLKIPSHLVMPLAADEPVQVGQLTVTAFSKCHDAADPQSFMVSCQGTNIGVFTDLGICCDNLVRHFKQCHAAFLEANYDDDLLANGRYPHFLKNRIRGGQGHLSNRQAVELLVNHRPEALTHLFLAHLSKENNCPRLVQDLFDAQALGTQIIVASREVETALYHINTRQKTAD